MKNILEFVQAKRAGRRIVILAAYDQLMARLLAESSADAILVGDSVAMVVHGFPSTVHATLEMMVAHTGAVRRGAPDAFVVADMPFLSVRRGRDAAVDAAGALMQAGASAVKIEGVSGHADIVRHLIGSGVPIMGHLGLMPQSVHQLGGYRLQGATAEQAAAITADAEALARAGAFALVLECVPAELARDLTSSLSIPTIGIGAGPGTDGQVLVLSDLLGLDPEFRPRFARRYRSGYEESLSAVNDFVRDVRAAEFPSPKEVPA